MGSRPIASPRNGRDRRDRLRGDAEAAGRRRQRALTQLQSRRIGLAPRPRHESRDYRINGWMVAISLACALLAFGFIYSLDLNPSGPLIRFADELGYAFEPLVDSGTGSEVAAPLLAGRSLAEARTAADSVGLDLVVESVPDDDADPSRILGQEPAAGVLLSPGESILVRVAAGSDRDLLESLIGQNVEAAQALLTDSGYVVDTVPIHHSDLPVGVVSEQFPEPGTDIEPGGRVTLTYNAGLRLEAVPDLTGLDLALAQRRAAAHGFESAPGGAAEFDARLPAGLVLEQFPVPGTVLPVGEQVLLRANQLPLVEVPDLVGLPLQQAREAGVAAGLRIERVVSPAPLPGRQLVVRAQSLAPARRVDLGTRVELIAGYPAEG